MTLDFNIHTIGYVEQGGGSITPSGTKAINENGVYDVTTYEKASVNVESTEPTLVTKTIVTNGTYSAEDDNADGYSSVSVNVPSTEPTLTELTVTPSTTSQTISPINDGFSTVTVKAVTALIDNDIIASNIKSGVNILGVVGTVTELVGETTTINSNGTYTPQNGNGFTSVSVNVAGTTPTGTYTITTNGTYDVTNYANADVSVSGGGGSAVGDIKREVVSGVYSYPTTSFTFKFPDDATSIGKAVGYMMFGCSDFSTTSSSTGLTAVDFNNITTISQQGALQSAFYGCTNLTSVTANKLESVTGNYAMSNTFAYTGLSTLSFPALKNAGNTNIWVYMLTGVTGCTVHFPSNLKTTMQSWSSVTSGFGGTNTTVLWDLPATN